MPHASVGLARLAKVCESARDTLFSGGGKLALVPVDKLGGGNAWLEDLTRYEIFEFRRL